ncbi:phosphatidylinositol transfer protein [Holotrichia oblita]|uniref:Phosphatidylinositol transfer protein n=1 Tax=Holotrichia oblita TaxID=644536 RepID=A0ACB9SI14_HOLOL|nr:phosphatidylinositol transfer protein [Holotrichia oblita]
MGETRKRIVPRNPRYMKHGFRLCIETLHVDGPPTTENNRVEAFIQKSERRLFTSFHRQVFCWMDRWYGLTMADIRAIEDKTKEELEALRQKGEVRGMRADTD